MLQDARARMGAIQSNTIPCLVKLGDLELQILHGSLLARLPVRHGGVLRVHRRLPRIEGQRRILQGGDAHIAPRLRLSETLLPLGIKIGEAFVQFIQDEFGVGINGSEVLLESGIVVVTGRRRRRIQNRR